jgi:hypothetical protein
VVRCTGFNRTYPLQALDGPPGPRSGAPSDNPWNGKSVAQDLGKSQP